ncbi:hypothetical protein ASE76_00045 [Xylophilus sp. Leaf220]|nr:hypothetical protein ASE76_00045 [Xylophilus sp. Leaf220]
MVVESFGVLDLRLYIQSQVSARSQAELAGNRRVPRAAWRRLENLADENGFRVGACKRDRLIDLLVAVRVQELGAVDGVFPGFDRVWRELKY